MGAAKPATMHRAAPMIKNDAAQNVNNAMVDKPGQIQVL